MLGRRHGSLLLLLLSGAVAASVASSSEVFIHADVASTDDPVDDEGLLATNTAPLLAASYVFPNDASILWNNGPFVTSPTGGASGNGLSMLEVNILNSLGYNVDRDDRASMAFDFNVTDPAGWHIGGFTFYSYQTNSGTTSTLNNVNVRIWKGQPGSGGRVVWGDVCINLFNATSWTGVYRASEGSESNSQRPIMILQAKTPDLYLPQGTYWVEWQAQGTLVSGPWAPPITILGQYATGNGLQYFPGNGWVDLTSGQTTQYPQGIPFLIHAGQESSSTPQGVTGFACLPETAPLRPNSTADSPEACIAACGAKLAPNNAFYFANLYGTGTDECGKFCTCSRTCHEKRQVAGQTYPVCLSAEVFDAKTTTNKKHTATVFPGGLVRYTLTLRQQLVENLDTAAAGLGVRFRLTPTNQISRHSKLSSKVKPTPAGYKSPAVGVVSNDGNATVITWPTLGLSYKKKYVFSVTFRLSKTASTGTRFVLQAELFQAAIAGVPAYCVRQVGSQTLTVKRVVSAK